MTVGRHGTPTSDIEVNFLLYIMIINIFYSILFYSILFYSILFHSILLLNFTFLSSRKGIIKIIFVNFLSQRYVLLELYQSFSGRPDKLS